ncbi:MAG: pseudouridine synthase [Candidatus Gastranaerophilales bacterium]|nr:pseudouridine synthase [Candidatus Gastranaerophilales bacterium]
MQKKTRINKFIAQNGLASRRGADDLISEGKVKLNGKTVTEPGVLVSEKDSIIVNGQKIEPQKKVYMVFYKPPGYITTRDDEKGRKTIYEFFPEKFKSLKPAGRLDKDSSGLLLMTNDGELIQKMTHPKIKVAKIYRVAIKGKITMPELEKLAAGVEIEKGKTAYAECLILEATKEKSELEVILYQGYNRQIRRMMELIGHGVISLKRIQHATLTLHGMNRGDYKILKPKQVQELNNHLRKIENPQDKSPKKL